MPLSHQFIASLFVSHMQKSPKSSLYIVRGKRISIHNNLGIYVNNDFVSKSFGNPS